MDESFTFEGVKSSITCTQKCGLEKCLRLSGKETATSAGKRQRHGFDPWVGDPLEKEMTSHSSILAWEVPWTEESGWLQSMGLQRVGHDQACMPQQLGLQ